MESRSDEKKEKLIIEGNAFYEIDLECVRKKKNQKSRQDSRNRKPSGMTKQSLQD